jgi:hypothetical protein
MFNKNVYEKEKTLKSKINDKKMRNVIIQNDIKHPKFSINNSL